MKSESRVKGYKPGTEGWKAEYNMLLDDGVTCAECRFCRWCCSMFGAKETNTSCDFYPNRFLKKEE